MARISPVDLPARGKVGHENASVADRCWKTLPPVAPPGHIPCPSVNADPPPNDRPWLEPLQPKGKFALTSRRKSLRNACLRASESGQLRRLFHKVASNDQLRSHRSQRNRVIVAGPLEFPPKSMIGGFYNMLPSHAAPTRFPNQLK